MAHARAQHILVRTIEEADKLKPAIKEMKSQAEFTELARKHSDCNSAQRGGDLGTFGPGAMLPEFDSAVWSAPIGQVVGPVKTQCGYHYILVNERDNGNVNNGIYNTFI